jgi:hypothetical protein
MQLFRSLRLLPLAAPLLVSTIARAQSANPPVTGKGLVGGALLGGEVVMLTEAALRVKPAWAYYVGGGVGAIGGGIAGHYLESSFAPKPMSAMYFLAAGMLLVIPTTVAAMNAVSYDTPLEYTQDAPPTDQPSDDTVSSGSSNPGNDMPTMPAVNNQSAPPPTSAPSTSPPPTAAPPPAAAPPAAPPPASAPSTTTNPTSSPAKPQGKRLQRTTHAVAHWRAAPVFVPSALLDISGKQLALTVPAVEIRDTYTRREVAMYGVKQQTEVRVPLIQMLF